MRKVYIHNKCVSPLKIVRCTNTRILDTALFIKFVSDLRKVGGCSPCTPVCPYNKTERHDITEILFKVALNTIIITPNPDGTGNEAVSPNKDQTDEET